MVPLELTLGAMLDSVATLAPTVLVLTAELESLLHAVIMGHASGIFVVTRGDMGLAATLKTEGDKAHN